MTQQRPASQRVNPILALGAAATIAIYGAIVAAPVRAWAHAYDVGALHIGHPWTRPTPNGAPTAVGYLTVTNRGAEPDRLIGGSSTAAASLEPHTMSMSGGMMRMRPVPGGYEIAPGATLTLSPGGDHLMFVGPKRPFRLGERIPATLKFEHAGKVKVEFVVQAQAPAGRSAMGPMTMR
jgi:copper(I)-binding protein